MSSNERFYFTTPSGQRELNGTYRPSGTLRQTPAAPTMYRARNFTKVHILSDRLPDPTPIILVGRERADTEDELSVLLADLESDLISATAFSRDDRKPTAVQYVTVSAVASEGGSENAEVTIMIIPTHVQTRGGGYFF